jgi:hypothetical protein
MLKLGASPGSAVADDMATSGNAQAHGGASASPAAEAASVLPRLTGWKFAVFRVVWVFALALAVGGTVAGVHYQEAWWDSVFRPLDNVGLRMTDAPCWARRSAPRRGPQGSFRDRG